MKEYYFGYLFVRLSKLIAVLFAVGGIVSVGSIAFQASMEITSLKYEASSSLGVKIFRLFEDWAKTQRILVTLGVNELEPTPLQVSSPPSSIASFDVLNEQLKKFTHDVDAAKELTVQKYEASLLEIEHKLRQHASNLGQKQQPFAEPTINDLPSNDVSEIRSIFAGLESSDIRQKRKTIDETHEFLITLLTAAENPANAKILRMAISELDNFGRFLPTDGDLPAPKIIRSDAVTEVPKLNAESVAEKLRFHRTVIREVVLTDWKVNDSLSEIRVQAESERKLCVSADRALRQLWFHSIVQSVFTFLVASFFAFFALVLSDLTKSFLDTARCSAKIASAYANPDSD